MMGILKFTDSVGRSILVVMTVVAIDNHVALPCCNSVDNRADVVVMADSTLKFPSLYMLFNNVIQMAFFDMMDYLSGHSHELLHGQLAHDNLRRRQGRGTRQFHGFPYYRAGAVPLEPGA